MKTSRIFVLSLVTVIAAGCNFLDSLPNGSYNEDNYYKYPTIVRGFIDKSYSLLPDNYYATEFLGTDCAADDMVYVDQSNNMRLFSTGTAKVSNNPFSGIWTRDYQGIYYANLFLKDDIGRNAHYLLDPESDAKLKLCLQGDAYALRAWYTWDLLKTFGGVGTDGQLLGIPLQTEAVETEDMDLNAIVRASYDETVEQILEDCDSAYAYLPYNNRDYPGDKIYLTPVIGAVRYRAFDQVTTDCLRAIVYLNWASPAFCQDQTVAKERYAKAAEYAAKAVRHKLDKESILGFNPKARYLWNDGNSPEAYTVSNIARSAIESHFYPQGFGSQTASCSTTMCPTEELVKAFPAANGYPITDSRSGYNPAKPYEGRDPRFYSDINYNGAKAIRNITPFETLYTFDIYTGGKDANKLTGNGVSGYYFRKFNYMNWCPADASTDTGYKCIFTFRFEQMLLVFAEAAFKSVGATTAINGLTAKSALAYLRARNTIDDLAGLGAESDPYLDECAGNPTAFEALVKNEWRITTVGEGMRYYNLRRWSNPDDLSAISGVTVHGVGCTPGGDGFTYETFDIETKSYPSLWNPLPYTELRKCPGIVQNKGWESWK